MSDNNTIIKVTDLLGIGRAFKVGGPLVHVALFVLAILLLDRGYSFVGCEAPRETTECASASRDGGL